MTRDRRRGAAQWLLGAFFIALAVSLPARPTTGSPAPLYSLPMHLTWRAPYGDPDARTDLTVDWADSLRNEPLYLSFELPADRIMRLRAVSAALLIEPAPGDTLQPFWFFERNGLNSGNLRVDFDFGNLSTCESPWMGYVSGHVGYGHVATRGRLDLSCDATNVSARGLPPGTRACFARIKIWFVRYDLPGWRRPMSFRLIGARFLTGSGKVIRSIPGPDARVSWNGGRVRSERERRAASGAEAWVPVISPPSWTALRDTAMRTIVISADTLLGH